MVLLQEMLLIAMNKRRHTLWHVRGHCFIEQKRVSGLSWPNKNTLSQAQAHICKDAKNVGQKHSELQIVTPCQSMMKALLRVIAWRGLLFKLVQVVTIIGSETVKNYFMQALWYSSSRLTRCLRLVPIVQGNISERPILEIPTFPETNRLYIIVHCITCQNKLVGLSNVLFVIIICGLTFFNTKPQEPLKHPEKISLRTTGL